MRATLKIATRRSPLAKEQAARVASLISTVAGVRSELVLVKTVGDSDLDAPIESLSGRGVFTNDVDEAVALGRADLAVHSAKDLPSQHLAGPLVLAAVPERVDVRDALVGRRLDELETGAPVASGSPRRRAQLAHRRPDLRFVALRGNIGTRLEKVPPKGAVVVACAALERLGLLHAAAEVLSLEVMLPQVGQGALALRCREDDEELRELLARIDDRSAHTCVRAERAFLAHLGGGCNTPLGAHARLERDEIVLEGLIASLDGATLLRASARGSDPEAVGESLAARLVAQGGAALLAAVPS